MTFGQVRALAAVAATALLSVVVLASSASAKPTVPPLDGPMLITGLGDLCPGFAPFIPGDPVADDGTQWFTGYFNWDPGEYLWFASVDQNTAGVVRTVGAGVPPGYPGWMPTSDHTYKVVGHVTGQSEFEIFDYVRLAVRRDDGAEVSGDAQIQLGMNHGILVTNWTSQPSCRVR